MPSKYLKRAMKRKKLRKLRDAAKVISVQESMQRFQEQESKRWDKVAARMHVRQMVKQ